MKGLRRRFFVGLVWFIRWTFVLFYSTLLYSTLHYLTSLYSLSLLCRVLSSKKLFCIGCCVFRYDMHSSLLYLYCARCVI